jgi:hypothetical protein
MGMGLWLRLWRLVWGVRNCVRRRSPGLFGRAFFFRPAYAPCVLWFSGIHAQRWNGGWNCAHTRLPASALFHLVPGETNSCGTNQEM